MIAITITRIYFSNSPVFLEAEYTSKFNPYSLGTVTIKQKDGHQLIIYNVTWSEWITLQLNATDEEVDYLKTEHKFSYK